MFTAAQGRPFEITDVNETGLKIRTSTGHFHSAGHERIEGACCLWLRGFGITRDSLVRAGFTKKEAGNLSYTPVIVETILAIASELAMSEARGVPLHPKGPGR